MGPLTNCLENNSIGCMWKMVKNNNLEFNRWIQVTDNDHKIMFQNIWKWSENEFNRLSQSIRKWV